MENNEFVDFKCMEIKQPIGTFYSGRMRSQDLIDISFADVLRIEKRDVERYLGVERPLSTRRVNELAKYVETIDATFPTGVILAVSSKDADYDEKREVMRIRKGDDVAKIIDGQHRIAGLKSFSGKEFEMNVTMFVDMDMEDQGMVFAVINLEQTKVNKSIVYSLYEYAKSRSPQKTCHNIAKLLNSTKNSPFKDKIKILGSATGKSKESLTQATFVERLLSYISREPMIDRDTLKRGKNLNKVTGSEERRLIFRNMFIDKRDEDIAKVVWNYFAVVEYKWFEAWYESIAGNILNRTTGFGALMSFFRNAYLSLGDPGDIITAEQFKTVFERIKLNEEDFTPENYRPGATGERELYMNFCEQTGLYSE